MIREGFISNSSSTSFIIRSKINLKDKIDNDELLTAKESTKLNKLNTLLSYYKSNA